MIDRPPSEVRAALAERIGLAIDRSGLNGREVADGMGVSPQSISSWRKTGKIAKERLPQFAAIVGVSIQWLMGEGPGDEIREPDGLPYQALTSRDRVWLDLLHSMPASEQEKLFRELQEKKSYYEALIVELSGRRGRR